MATKMLVLPLLLSACIAGDGDDSIAEPQWFFTCGDPVCQGYTGPFEGVDLCTSEVAGDACASAGASCDPQDDCNALLTCATEDPTQQPGGCPISLRSAKRDIRYIDAAERDALARSLLDTRLARWSYRSDAPSARPHLGFIIDDQPSSPAVHSDGAHVDLYGYTSLTVATLQAQQAQIEAMQAELAALRAELAALRATPR